VPAISTQLDEFVPVYQFHEYYSVRIAAPAEDVYRAVKTVTADEISLFRTLTWLRRFGRSGPASILNAPLHQPVIEVALETSFLLLAEQANREIVVGTVVITPSSWCRGRVKTPEAFKALDHPGFAVAAMNFLIEAADAGMCKLSTETRIHATDAGAKLRFGVYWTLIYPGSAFIRWMWLRAIARRARGM